MKSTNFYILLSVFFVIISGCQPQKETIVERTVVVDGKSQQTGGVNEGGGGSGIDGIPLDAFIDRNFDQNEAYKLKVQPLIQTLAKKFPRLAADFYHLTHQRDWYFVPGQLEAIPQNILGSYTKTDQFALQDLNKVWIDKLQFEKMSLENQGILLIHELMMGVRLMQFKHRQDKCIAKAALIIFQDNGLKKYSEDKKYCRDTYPIIDGLQNEKFNLTALDYDMIRKVVALIDRAQPDADEAEAIIKAYKLRDYSD